MRQYEAPNWLHYFKISGKRKIGKSNAPNQLSLGEKLHQHSAQVPQQYFRALPRLRGTIDLMPPLQLPCSHTNITPAFSKAGLLFAYVGSGWYAEPDIPLYNVGSEDGNRTTK